MTLRENGFDIGYVQGWYAFSSNVEQVSLLSVCYVHWKIYEKKIFLKGIVKERNVAVSCVFF